MGIEIMRIIRGVRAMKGVGTMRIIMWKRTMKSLRTLKGMGLRTRKWVMGVEIMRIINY